MNITSVSDVKEVKNVCHRHKSKKKEKIASGMNGRLSKIMEKDCEFNFPLKCVICKNMLEKHELDKHICFSNYTYVCVDENNDLCPQLEDGTIVYESGLSSITPTYEDGTVYDEQSSSSITPTHEDIEELLINYVRKRRELWDHTLPLSSRSRDIIAKSWQEVSKELNGILTPKAACKKWRYLKDSYMRIRNDIIRKKSGSAANKIVKWKWYKFMQFLHDIEDSRSTSSNVSSKHDESASSETSGLEEDVPQMLHKRRKKSDDSFLDTVTSILREPIKIETSLPKEDTVPAPVVSVPVPVQSYDNIGHIMTLMGNILREFPDNEGLTHGLQLLQIVSEKRDQLRKKQ